MRRSMLFLPGNSPSMLMNGTALPADAIILDLEDAVAPDQKDAARDLVANALLQFDFGDREIIIRVNPVNTDFFTDDLLTLLPKKPDTIMLPKAESADDVLRVVELIETVSKRHEDADRVSIMPLIETSLGIEKAFEIASAHPRVTAIFLGAEDLSADMRCERTKEGTEILYARGRMVMAARAAGIAVTDTPFTDVNDMEGLEKDTRFAKGLGFSGKAVISPHHLQTVNRVFSPTDDEIAYAQDVMRVIEQGKKEGKGAVSLRGKMIDAPIVERARQTLEAAHELNRI